MDAQLKILPAKILVGIRVRTTAASDTPATYWRPFKMRLSEIDHAVTERFYSVQVYDGNEELTPMTEFEKWAAVEVSALTEVPDGMNSINIPPGLYAVFVHSGTPATFPTTLKFIFYEWLPNSMYSLDDRPHFEVMESDYRMDDPNAKEQVWIPIK